MQAPVWIFIYPSFMDLLWAFIPAVLLVIVMVTRTALEDKSLAGRIARL